MNAIEIKHLIKKFRVYSSRETSLFRTLCSLLLFKSATRYQEFNALNDINLKIIRGEVVGLIGQNGSGKSTLLKIIAGILYADQGNIKVTGSIGTLIELAAGFRQELTGRENIYINASILGHSKKEIDAKIETIVQFSGIGKFIDTPVRMYSMGMYMRLAFSIIINVDPQILLIDEILAVGDDNFQKKCIKKIEDFKEAGITIVLVSHNLQLVERICDRIVLLHNGRIIGDGLPREMISQYKRTLFVWKNTRLREEMINEIGDKREINNQYRWGTGEVRITGVVFLDEKNNPVEYFKSGTLFKVKISFESTEKIVKPVFGIAIHDEMGALITGPNTKTAGMFINEVDGKGAIDYIIPSILLLPGTYYLTTAIYDFLCLHPYDHWEKFWEFDVMENEKIKENLGILSFPSQWVFRHEK